MIIPTHNGALLTRACVNSLLANPPTTCDWEIIVVDDASSDDTDAVLAGYGSRVRSVSLPQNGGFAVACNAGAAQAGDCDYLVFLNNDTIVTPGWLDALVGEAESHPDVGAVGAKLLFPDGSVQHAGVAIGQDRWPRHLYAGFPGEHPAVDRPKWVAAATAACLLVRLPDFRLLNGFDTQFHNGFEDIDLCLRLGEHGRRIRYCPASVVYHLESVTRWPNERESTEHNDLLYRERWLSRVTPDDIQHFVEDGLISVEYGATYPVTLTVSPRLAALKHEGKDLEGVDQVLSARSEQVMELLAHKTRALVRERAASAPPMLVARSRANRDPTPIGTGSAHQLGDGSAGRLVSLLLPVKNEETSLRELLPLVLQQSVSVLLEIVGVDSGSEDGTIDVLLEFGATVLCIDAADFDHGLTRNLAAAHAKGEVLLFLNGRTRPANDRWLGPLLAALDDDPTVAAACSRVIPHPDADVLSQRDGELELSGSAVRQRKQISDWQAYRHASTEERRAFLNFHTVSAAIRADLFARKPFQPVRTIGEDLLWARHVLEDGWALVHEPASVACHSHPYTLRELFCRNVDDGIANCDINGRSLEESELLPLIDALVDQDWSYLRDVARLTGDELDRWERESVLRRVAQVIGQWVGVNYEKLPEGTAAAFSRIGQARRRGRVQPPPKPRR